MERGTETRHPAEGAESRRVSNDRRQQQRRERREQRQQRRRSQSGFEAAGPVQFPGVIGWFQRNQRTFFVVGIVVMVLSLGAGVTIFGGGVHSSSNTTSSTRDDSGTGTAAIRDDTDPGDGDAAADATADDPDADAAGDGDEPVVDEDGIVRSYAAAPAMEIDPANRYEAIIRTEKGDIRIELLPQDAPGYVNNFVFLARNRFYDGLTFHRVVPDFIAQAGDPTGTSLGGSGYSLDEELNDLPIEAGIIAMAKSSLGVSGGQFFITSQPAAHLEAQGFTVFGRVIEGLEVVRALTPRDPQAAGQPPGDRIFSIEIIEEPS